MIDNLRNTEDGKLLKSDRPECLVEPLKLSDEALTSELQKGHLPCGCVCYNGDTTKVIHKLGALRDVYKPPNFYDSKCSLLIII